MYTIELKSFVELLMISDPWPLQPNDHVNLETFADREAGRHGFKDWVEAYHELNGTEMENNNEPYQS